MVQVGICCSPAPDNLDSETVLFLTDQLLTVVKGPRVFSKASMWDLLGPECLCWRAGEVRAALGICVCTCMDVQLN